jgi:hypothetical protein
MPSPHNACQRNAYNEIKSRTFAGIGVGSTLRPQKNIYASASTYHTEERKTKSEEGEVAIIAM